MMFVKMFKIDKHFDQSRILSPMTSRSEIRQVVSIHSVVIWNWLMNGEMLTYNLEKTKAVPFAKRLNSFDDVKMQNVGL